MLDPSPSRNLQNHLENGATLSDAKGFMKNKIEQF
jgi:hypothetical protein